MHKMLFEKAFESVNSGKDVELGPVHVCEVCGYTLEGETPDRCPICNALKEKFTAFR
ncbi:rubredoxin-like domain-containing protein [Methanosarcina sp. KYL-1]|uniref:rubredoxin-like domain-containing protein n=1 Tax=Methanosarcina sp. KYL-1 TaxID=2602068 RepID=UPI00350E5507